MPLRLANTGNSEVVIHWHENHAPGVSLKGLALPRHLKPGENVQLQMVFAPATAQTLNGKITYHSSAANHALPVAVSGTAVAAATLTANPPSLSFGNVQVGKTATLSQTITNTTTSSVTLQQVTESGSGFAVSGIQTPLTLAPSHSVTFQVSFTPTKTGSSTGSFSVLTSPSKDRVSVVESGTGTAAGSLALSPASLSFGNVQVGSSKSQGATLSASGASVTITSDALSNSEYAISGISLPLTLAKGKSVTLNVTFTPQAAGTANAKLSFSTSGGSGASESLAGTGVGSSQHSVTLGWQDSASSISGYNVYRGTVSGGPYNRITSLDPSTSYVDSSVSSGTTYYYVVTSVNQQGAESKQSSQVSATIP
jgi:hypothetical protein